MSILQMLLTARAVTAGDQTFGTAGSNNFVVPSYNSLTVTVDGAGGGGAGTSGAGANGGNSSFNTSPAANGGAGGTAGTAPTTNGTNGAAGTASGGTTNTTGGGAAGGTGATRYEPDPKDGDINYVGGNGGAGGRAVKVYTPGQLTVGATIAVQVGTAGAIGAGLGSPGATPGTVGRVYVEWT